MVKWIKTSEYLPALHTRVLVWIPNTNLFNWDGEPVCAFLMEREPDRVFGNNEVPYSWRCENSGNAFGQEVSHWAEFNPPDKGWPMKDDKEEIWVCAKCLQASCWAGIFMCWESQTADIKKITKGEARKLKLESEDYIQLPEVQANA